MGTRTSGATPAGKPAVGVPTQLAGACPDVALASAADAVCGQPARYVAAPASTQEAAAVLKAAADLGLTVVPRGTGSKLDWGAPPSGCDLIVETRSMKRVLEHAAGDLVVSVQAGVRLEQLAEILASAGQRLALDPPGGGTIGGVLATQVAGPLRFRFGAPRDLLIGITVVRADGTVARSGGKVVKNVAGYDLGKLFAGSYGTLGLITEATFRLHPAPAASAVSTLGCSDTQSAAAAVQAAADSPLTPSAIELDWPGAANPIAVSVLLEGDEASVAERADRMRNLLGDRASDQPEPDRRARAGAGSAVGPVSVWGRWPAGDREHSAADGTVLRVGFWPGQLAPVLDAIRIAAAGTGLDPSIGGSAAAGVLHVEVAAGASADAVARMVDALRDRLVVMAHGAGIPPATASAVVLYAPATVRDALNMWGPVPSLRLMQAVKDQFDPEHRMAPGRFAGGI